MSVRPVSPNRGRRLWTWAFWLGVGLAPIAALLLVVAQGAGPLRAAAVLAVLGVVFVGMSVAFREDPGDVRDELTERLRDEVDRLRRDLEGVRQAADRSLHGEAGALRGELAGIQQEVARLAGETARLAADGAILAKLDRVVMPVEASAVAVPSVDASGEAGHGAGHGAAGLLVPSHLASAVGSAPAIRGVAPAAVPAPVSGSTPASPTAVPAPVSGPLPSAVPTAIPTAVPASSWAPQPPGASPAQQSGTQQTGTQQAGTQQSGTGQTGTGQTGTGQTGTLSVARWAGPDRRATPRSEQWPRPIADGGTKSVEGPGDGAAHNFDDVGVAGAVGTWSFVVPSIDFEFPDIDHLPEPEPRGRHARRPEAARRPGTVPPWR